MALQPAGDYDADGRWVSAGEWMECPRCGGDGDDGRAVGECYINIPCGLCEGLGGSIVNDPREDEMDQQTEEQEVLEAAVKWFRAAHRFHEEKHNLDAFVDMGRAEFALRDAVGRYERRAPRVSEYDDIGAC